MGSAIANVSSGRFDISASRWPGVEMTWKGAGVRRYGRALCIPQACVVIAKTCFCHSSFTLNMTYAWSGATVACSEAVFNQLFTWGYALQNMGLGTIWPIETVRNSCNGTKLLQPGFHVQHSALPYATCLKLASSTVIHLMQRLIPARPTLKMPGFPKSVDRTSRHPENFSPSLQVG